MPKNALQVALDALPEPFREVIGGVVRSSFISGFVEARNPLTPKDTLEACSDADRAFETWKKKDHL